MKHHFKFLATVLFPVLTGLSMFISSCLDESRNNPQDLADKLAGAFVPDKREGIWNVSVIQKGRKNLILNGETNSPLAVKAVSDSLYKAGYNVIDSVKVLPDTVLNQHYMGLAALSVINLRREPAHSAELISQCVMGTPVMILKEDDGWILIQTPDNYIAWTEKSSVKAMSLQELQKWNHSDRVIFQSGTGSITTLPGSGDIVGDLVAGAIMVRTVLRKDYAGVLLPDGRSGYVSTGDLMDFKSYPDPPSPTGEEILSRASRYTGLPYLWGGTSAKAVDCSGFVQSVYLLNGLILARDASLQAQNGIEVDISGGYDNLQKGDLLFFGSVGAKGPRVTHVAIYRGNKEFIHAASRVMINSFDSTRADFSAYRKKSLLSARRILGAEFSRGIMPLVSHKWYN